MRARTLCKLIALEVVCCVAGCVAHVAPPVPEPYTPIVTELLEAHNDARVYHHVRPLALDDELCRQAQEHARWMTVHGLRHNPGGAENIGWNYPTAETFVDACMNDWPHRANILGQGYTRFGGGMARDRNGQPYWCARFE